MPSPNPIGGYFELELRRGPFPHQESILLNSGRACFEYLLRALKAQRVYLPRFTCDVMLEPIQRLGVEVTFYELTREMTILELPELREREYLVYTNYFGVMDAYCALLARVLHGRLILDYSQAFFSTPIEGSHTFFSPRKFLGVSDGGCLYTSCTLEGQLGVDNTSHLRFSHLIKRWELGPQAGYPDFKSDDASLSNVDMAWMSPLTLAILRNVDYPAVLALRKENAAILDTTLGRSNLLKIDLASAACPMVYPFWTKNRTVRQHLIEQGIFVATYWPNVLEWCEPGDVERDLATEVLPLPVDQRYGAKEMNTILDLLTRLGVA